MNLHRWQQIISVFGSRGGRRGPASDLRRHRPFVEPMEPRRLLATVAEFPVPTADGGPVAIAAGRDGNLWFTEAAKNRIGMINPTTHAVADFPIPTADSTPQGIAAGPDGRLWFTELTGNKIGSIDPSSHRIADYPIPTAGSAPIGITTGPDGNLWFTERQANKIGTINPTTHAITEFTLPPPTVEVVENAATPDGTTHRALSINAVPPPSSEPSGITVGADGNLWFTEELNNKIGTINPSTHTIAEFPIPTARSQPLGIAAGPDGKIWFTEVVGRKLGSIDLTTHTFVETSLTAGTAPIDITAGPDGSLWFTESGANEIGAVSPVTHVLSETPVPTANAIFQGIAPGPDGNLWFAEASASKIGVLTPTLNFVITDGSPTFVAPGASFSLTVAVNYLSGQTDTDFNGDVTLALATNPGGATLGGTLTAAAHHGIASFTGLTINRAGTFRITAAIGPGATAPAAILAVAVPPTVVAEKALFAGKGRSRHLVGFELDFSRAMDPARVTSPANYALTQSLRRGRQLVVQPVDFRAAYDAPSHSVTLTLIGKPKFARGGKLVVVTKPPGGVADAAGVPLDGGDRGMFGDNGSFAIAPRGSGISR
jgi:streptogramin lyase